MWEQLHCFPHILNYKLGPVTPSAWSLSPCRLNLIYYFPTSWPWSWLEIIKELYFFLPRKIDINELFENIFDHLWAKRLPLPLSVKDELVVLLQSEMLSAIASNLTSIVTQEPFQVPSNSTKKISNSSKKIKRSPMPKEQQFSRGSKIAIWADFLQYFQTPIKCCGYILV